MDLFVIQETNQKYVDRCVAIAELVIPRPFPLDIIVKTPQEIALALQKSDYFIKEIIERGRVLYERSNESTRLDRISTYSAKVRYPGEDPTVDEAKEAFEIAKSVRKFAKSLTLTFAVFPQHF